MKSDRVGKLDTARDVRKEAARLYRSARKGDVAAGDASKLASVLNLIIRSIETSDIEERLSRLEGNHK